MQVGDVAVSRFTGGYVLLEVVSCSVSGRGSRYLAAYLDREHAVIVASTIARREQVDAWTIEADSPRRLVTARGNQC